MLISNKTTRSIYLFILFIFFFFDSKEEYQIVRQLEKITVKKRKQKLYDAQKTKLILGP